MMKTRYLAALAIGLLLSCLAGRAQAADMNVWCLTGTSATGAPNWQPASAANPCPVSATVTATATASATPTAISAGANQVLNMNLFSSLFEQPTFAGTPVDGTHGLPVNCIVGCAGGTSSNASDAVATSATNGQTLAWIYAFNGTTWDRLQDDASKNLKINLQVVPSGAFASGALAVGSGTDGWNATEGTTTDAAAAAGGTGTISAKLREATALLNTVNTSINSNAVTNVGGYDSGSAPIQTKTPANSSHAAGTSIGGLFSVPVARSNGGAGIITNLTYISTGGSTGQFVLRLWDKNPTGTTCTDNSAFVEAIADDQHLIATPLSITPAAPAVTTGDTNTYASLAGVTFDYKNQDGTPSQNVYACLVTVATDTADENKPIYLNLTGPQD